MNFSYDDLEVSKKTLFKLKNSLKNFKMNNKGNIPSNLDEILSKFKSEFIEALNDDLNTPKALSFISIAVKQINKLISNNDTVNVYKAFEEINNVLLNVLGIDLGLDKEQSNEEKLIELLINVRNKLRAQKNYELSDVIREELAKLEISVSDK